MNEFFHVSWAIWWRHQCILLILTQQATSHLWTTQSESDSTVCVSCGQSDLPYPLRPDSGPVDTDGVRPVMIFQLNLSFRTVFIQPQNPESKVHTPGEMEESLRLF